MPPDFIDIDGHEVSKGPSLPEQRRVLSYIVGISFVLAATGLLFAVL